MKSIRRNIQWINFIILLPLIFSGCKEKNKACIEETSDIPPPEQEPVLVHEIPKPSGVIGWGAPKFTPDGNWVSFAFAPTDDINKRRIGLIHEDGSGFQCLTCNLNYNAGPHIWFPDGETLLFYFFNLYEPNFFVFELSSPDRYYEIQNISTPGELTHDRFPVLSPDGKKLVWTKVRYDGFHIVMGDLVRDDNGYHVENVRHLYPPTIIDENDPDQWARANAWYEAKSFTGGGRTLVFSATLSQAGNVDDFLLDLETGEITRITTHPEWDEGAEFSPDGLNFLNGNMEISVPLAGMATWTAEIKLSGCQSGFLQLSLDINGTQAKGFIKSERDGRKHERNF